MPLSTPTRSVRALVVTALAAATFAASGTSADGASSAVVVTMTVPSASSIDVTACAAGTPATTIGSVLPGTSAVTSAPCAVTFGSTNDTAMLHLRQSDTYGQAMFRPTLGPLDTGFNTTGYRITAVTGGNDNAYSAVVQPDGKLVVAGWTNATGGGDPVIIRYTTAGLLDPSFGSGGIATFNLGDFEVATSLALQPDGKLVFAGIMGGGATSDFLVGRLTGAGALDPSFGTGGTVRTAITAQLDRANAVTLQPDGKVLAIGASRVDGTVDDISVARYSSDGVLDATFGTGGITTVDMGGYEYANHAGLQADGKLVVAGQRANSALLLRFTTAGVLDPSYGSGGSLALQPLGRSTSWRTMALATNGQVLAAGNSYNGTYDEPVVARITTAGALDTTFGASGYAIRNLGAQAGSNGIWQQPDGAIALVGNAPNDFFAARLTASGLNDTSFGTAGLAIVDNGGVNNETYAGVQGPDGTAYLVGRSGASGNWDIDVARLGALTVPDYGASTWASAGGVFGACLANVTGTGAASTWAPAGIGNCTATDTGSFWHAVPTAGTKVASSTTSGTPSVTANLHFGMRAATAQSPGSYVAPVTFDIYAPDA